MSCVVKVRNSMNTNVCSILPPLPYPHLSSEGMQCLLFFPNVYLNLFSDSYFIFVYCYFPGYKNIPLSHFSSATLKFVYL